MVRAIVGANWGDEGKGKITDMFAAQSNIVVRFQGGANAGHTIINDYGKFALHLLPSGVFYDHVVNVIGNGVAFDVNAFLRELDSITKSGVPMPHILISDRAQVMMPYHILLDTYEEERLSARSFGSTKSGIAPFYSDKYAKIGFQICELFDEKAFLDKLRRVCEVKNVLITHLYGKPPIVAEEIYEQFMSCRDRLRPFVGDTFNFLHDAAMEGKNILLEGQLGSLRDPDLGIYPYSTSSSPTAGFAAVGAGVPPQKIESVTVVTKAYSSAVGAGPFVSEIFGDQANELRRLGGDAGEYGATTGRPRRMGWFDTVATRHGCRVQGATEAVLTAIDVLGYLDEIPVCTGYKIDGQIVGDFPVTPLLYRAEPILEMLPGWKSDIRGIKELSKLPRNAMAYLRFIEERIGVPITIVSTGPRRDEFIKL